MAQKKMIEESFDFPKQDPSLKYISDLAEQIQVASFPEKNRALDKLLFLANKARQEGNFLRTEAAINVLGETTKFDPERELKDSWKIRKTARTFLNILAKEENLQPDLLKLCLQHIGTSLNFNTKEAMKRIIAEHGSKILPLDKDPKASGQIKTLFAFQFEEESTTINALFDILDIALERKLDDIAAMAKDFLVNIGEKSEIPIIKGQVKTFLSSLEK